MLGRMLDLMVAENVDYLRAHPETPRLYQAKGPDGQPIKYVREDMGIEEWQEIPAIIAQGWGDCEDLASWLAAERIVKDGLSGTKAYLERRHKGGIWLYHVKVRLPNGTEEDPSKMLGMKGAG